MNKYELTLDRERTLVYSNRSFRELEKRTGKSPIEHYADCIDDNGGYSIKKALSKFGSVDFIASFLWAGMIHENVPYEKVVDIIPLKDFTKLINFIINVIVTEYGLGDKAEGGEEKKSITETTGTGTMQSV